VATDGVVRLASADPCADYPHYHIEKVLHSNLGGKGPDGGEEGIVFAVTTSHTDLNLHGRTVELHLHATSDYSPSWPKENGFFKNFARINLAPGTKVDLEIHAWDPEENKTLELLGPDGGITFFDLDTGATATEYIKSEGFKKAILPNTTELKRQDSDEYYTSFYATVRGNGTDNPTNALQLTMLQKNRAITFIYEHTENLNFELGCTDGKETRVFSFVFRPVMLCADTLLEDGSVVSAEDSPYELKTEWAIDE
jgi:hypothetical protein